jgi:Fe2+ transport system protein FeoA
VVAAAGETSELSREIPVGHYRVRLTALGEVLEEPITIIADQTSSLDVGIDGDRLALRH